MKRKNKHYWKKKEDVQEVKKWIYLFKYKYSMILIHLNVSTFFKKQHTDTLHNFANRRSLDESSNSMEESIF